MRGGGHEMNDVGAAQLPLTLEDIIGAIVQVFEISGLLRWQTVANEEQADAPAAPSGAADEDAAKK